MTITHIKQLYLKWISNIVGCRDMDLLRRLNDVEFRWSIELDENWASHALYFARDPFNEYLLEHYEVDPEVEVVMGPVSVLEVIVAMCCKMDNLLWDCTVGDQRPRWFKVIMNASGLGSATADEFDYIINRILDRKIDFNGNGGWFPLRINEQNRDQRTLDIWRQLNAYIMENPQLEARIDYDDDMNCIAGGYKGQNEKWYH